MKPNTLSISVRLRRRQAETAQVSVSITEDLMRSNEEGEGKNLDVDKIIEAALKLGKLDSTQWETEGEPEIQLHPIQNSPGKTNIQ
jgi:hypothetical protein